MRNRPRRRLLTILMACVLPGFAGCQPIAAIMDKTGGDPTEPAHYVPAHDNLAIVVEDFQNPALIEEAAEHIDWLVAMELMEHKVAPIINPNKITVLRTSNPHAYRQMKIPAIGATVGAKQILYVDVTDFTIQSAVGTDALKAHAEARVKIVDCVTGRTRWPRDATTAGFPIAVGIPYAADDENVSDVKIRAALSQALASKVARLFYEATLDASGSAPRYPETDFQ